MTIPMIVCAKEGFFFLWPRPLCGSMPINNRTSIITMIAPNKIITFVSKDAVICSWIDIIEFPTPSVRLFVEPLIGEIGGRDKQEQFDHVE